MNFQQLRYVRETVRRNLNLTEAANALFTSQPGVSKQIKELEEELGVAIFERRGRRFVGLTEAGKALVKIIERVLQESENLKRVGRDFADAESGGLTVATTHTQARYALPRVVAEFRKRHPKVHLALLQTHSVVVPLKHPLAKLERVTLADLARYPIVTYSPEFTGRTHINEAFTSQGLDFDVVLTAIDSDVIKTYVELGLGIGIIAAMAYDAARDRNLVAIEAGHLFGVNTTRIAIKRGTYLSAFAYEFIELFAPKLTRRVIERALAGEGAR